ncbi:MAG: hypothetical protein MJ014_05570 [Methanocorpusculum sp.]|nr:hypothetical protein [Methanocorpusculum sp.]
MIPQNARIVFVPQSSANSVPTPSQPYTALYDVKVENILDEAVKQVDFLFGVPIGVVTDAGFDPHYDIELLRYTDAWEKLETHYVCLGRGRPAGGHGLVCRKLSRIFLLRSRLYRERDPAASGDLDAAAYGGDCFPDRPNHTASHPPSHLREFLPQRVQ